MVYLFTCCCLYLLTSCPFCPGYFAEDEVKLQAKEPHECVCEGSACASGNRCKGYQCFSSLTVTAGSRRYQKGCFNIYEQSTMTCKTPPSTDQIVDCCQGHLCNLNRTVELPVKGIVVATQNAAHRYCLSAAFCGVQLQDRDPSIVSGVALLFIRSL